MNYLEHAGYLGLSGLYNAGQYVAALPNKIFRRRHKELYRIAEEIVSILDREKITKEEGCELRALVEKIWSLEKEVV